MTLRPSLVLAALLVSQSAQAESFASIQTRQPEFFHARTGYRIDRQHAPTPDDIPAPITPIDATQASRLLQTGALAIDVFGAPQSRYDELEGTWLVRDPRMSLPGAIWLPETGRGSLTPDLDRYLTGNLEKATGGNTARPVIVFCVADCWMSWNAAQRISALGYTSVYWLRHGTDGWLDAGFELEPVMPIAVDVD